jgi:hypothetical protein
MVSDLAVFGHCLPGVEQNMSFFNQCSICALFFRLIESEATKQRRHVNHKKAPVRFGSGGMPGRIGEVS